MTTHDWPTERQRPWLYLPGELHDSKGYPIYPGDLLRSYHFTEARYRRRNWLYHVVIYHRDQHGFWSLRLRKPSELEPTTPKIDKVDCLLTPDLATTSEIIDGSGPHRDWLNWRDRPRKMREVARVDD